MEASWHSIYWYPQAFISAAVDDINFSTGRQLFERNRNLEEDTLMEEGTISVDFSQYERTKAEEVEEEEEDRVRFSDSD